MSIVSQANELIQPSEAKSQARPGQPSQAQGLQDTHGARVLAWSPGTESWLGVLARSPSMSPQHSWDVTRKELAEL